MFKDFVIEKAKRIKKVVSGLFRDCNKYFIILPPNLKPIENNSDDWFLNYRVLPHALGGIDGKDYTNSKEALEHSFSNGYRVFECDVSFTKDFVPVMAHEGAAELSFSEFMNGKIDGKYSPLALADIISFARNNRDTYFLLDTKEKMADVARFLKDNASDVIDRFIIQLGRVKDYKNVCKVHKFKYFHWNFSVDGNLNQHLAFVVKNKIYTCSLTPKMAKRNRLKYIKRFNVKPFAYTINDVEELKGLAKLGVWGCITDFISNLQYEEAKKAL